MAIKVQYNPSTGKVSYNPATGKVQVLNTEIECVNCIDTPLNVTLDFNDVVIRDGCYKVIGLNVGVLWENVPDINTLFTLTQSTESDCLWEYTTTIDPPTKRTDSRPFTSICDGATQDPTKEWDTLVVTLEKLSPTLAKPRVVLHDSNDVDVDAFAFLGVNYNPSSRCVDANGVTQILDFADVTSPMYDGTVDVSEVI